MPTPYEKEMERLHKLFPEVETEGDSDFRVYSGTPGWVGRRHFFRPLTTSAILVPVFPTGWDLARSKKGLRFLASSVPGVNAIRWREVLFRYQNLSNFRLKWRLLRR
ncbi:hypothetical protein AVEN_162776-1 [Araneus ventricosus]|uniref:Uncharacterized protein n=1 Tax=Araneus ventricosus TaxID=182803 RepID=A0A4Y2TUP4_ARAVE|nr:hypothetical protein AVEN_162776-1 [Araneus ventricosus]